MKKITKSDCVKELRRVARKIGHSPTIEEFEKHAKFCAGTAENLFGSWNKAKLAAGLKPCWKENRFTQEQCISELKSIARKIGHSPSAKEFDKHATFTNQVVMSRFGSWNKAKLAAGLNINNRMDISNKECLDELRRVAKQLGHTPTQAEFNTYAQFCSMTIGKRFGTWCKGVKAAGLVPVRSHFTKSQSISELKRVAHKLGHTPTGSEFDKHASFRCHFTHHLFGSWHKALKAAGLPPTRRTDVSKADCIIELKRITRKLGHTPTLGEFNEHATFSEHVIQRCFESWNKGLLAAGLMVNIQTNISKDEYVRELKRVAKKLGHTPTQAEFDKRATFKSCAINRRFGTWNKAVEAAGLKIGHRKDIPNSEILTEIQRVAKKIGHTPTREDFIKHAKFSTSLVQARFGLWNNALKTIGLTPNNRINIPQSEMLSELKRVAKKIGHTPTKKEFNKHAAFGGEVVYLRFGSWNKALRAAHLNINKHGKVTAQECIIELQRVAKKIGHTPTGKEFNRHATFCIQSVQKYFGGSYNNGLLAAGLTPNHPTTPSTLRAANTAKAHRILVNMPMNISNLFTDVTVMGLFMALGKVAPSLIPEIKQKETLIKITRPKTNEKSVTKALKSAEDIIALTKGQMNGVLLSTIMQNTLDRMHTNHDHTLRKAVLKSNCNFARIVKAQFRREYRRAKELMKFPKGIRYEQTLLTVKLERPQEWYLRSGV